MRTFLAAALAAAVISAAGADDKKEKDVEKLLKDIEEAAKAKDFSKMIELAQKAEKLDDKNPAIYFALGTAHTAKREHADAVKALEKVVGLAPEVAVAHDRLGDAYLKNGQFKEAVKSFDTFLGKVKDAETKKHHWRRGIALYYAAEYDKGAKQFEIHHEVNKEDVENSVWNYACLLRREIAAGKKAEEAKPTAAKGLFEAKSDGREPLQAILVLFKTVSEDGTAKVVKVMDDYKKGKASAEEKKEAEFYGNLYLALYCDAEKKTDLCKKYLEQAVGKDAKDPERAKKAISHYMWDVAVAHLDHFEELKKRP